QPTSTSGWQPEIRGPWVARKSPAFLDAFSFLPSQRVLPVLLQGASALRPEWALDLAFQLKFRDSVLTFAFSDRVLALLPPAVTVLEALPMWPLALERTVSRRTQYQCTGQRREFPYGSTSRKLPLLPSPHNPHSAILNPAFHGSRVSRRSRTHTEAPCLEMKGAALNASTI